MMPINWIISFLFFLSIYLIFNIMNYYIYNINFNNNNDQLNFKFKNLNWKW
uniref:ATP synthase F0 subunit 8 n=1 Tax=Paragabara curvicornuta TaxID=1819811 RepID=A0A1W5KPV2_9NEOP|nr:ATP synthase F0 subunit 8 [Paragabara curvicornuta]AMX21657.1 ATP synthase F0 subunit 8 [Paragabara curvicornuta]